MAGKVLNIKFCSPFKLRSGLTRKYHAICHYSYNLPFSAIRSASCTERAGGWRGAAAKRTAPNKPVNAIGCNPTAPTARALCRMLRKQSIT